MPEDIKQPKTIKFEYKGQPYEFAAEFPDDATDDIKTEVALEYLLAHPELIKKPDPNSPFKIRQRNTSIQGPRLISDSEQARINDQGFWSSLAQPFVDTAITIADQVPKVIVPLFTGKRPQLPSPMDIVEGTASMVGDPIIKAGAGNYRGAAGSAAGLFALSRLFHPKEAINDIASISPRTTNAVTGGLKTAINEAKEAPVTRGTVPGGAGAILGGMASHAAGRPWFEGALGGAIIGSKGIPFARGLYQGARSASGPWVNPNLIDYFKPDNLTYPGVYEGTTAGLNFGPKKVYTPELVDEPIKYNFPPEMQQDPNPNVRRIAQGGANPPRSMGGIVSPTDQVAPGYTSTFQTDSLSRGEPTGSPRYNYPPEGYPEGTAPEFSTGSVEEPLKALPAPEMPVRVFQMPQIGQTDVINDIIRRINPESPLALPPASSFQMPEAGVLPKVNIPPLSLEDYQGIVYNTPPMMPREGVVSKPPVTKPVESPKAVTATDKPAITTPSPEVNVEPAKTEPAKTEPSKVDLSEMTAAYQARVDELRDKIRSGKVLSAKEFKELQELKYKLTEKKEPIQQEPIKPKEEPKSVVDIKEATEKAEVDKANVQKTKPKEIPPDKQAPKPEEKGTNPYDVTVTKSQVFDEIKNRISVTAETLQKEFGISADKAKELLVALTSDGKLQRTGAGIYSAKEVLVKPKAVEPPIKKSEYKEVTGPQSAGTTPEVAKNLQSKWDSERLARLQLKDELTPEETIEMDRLTEKGVIPNQKILDDSGETKLGKKKINVETGKLEDLPGATKEGIESHRMSPEEAAKSETERRATVTSLFDELKSIPENSPEYKSRVQELRKNLPQSESADPKAVHISEVMAMARALNVNGDVMGRKLYDMGIPVEAGRSGADWGLSKAKKLTDAMIDSHNALEDASVEALLKQIGKMPEKRTDTAGKVKVRIEKETQEDIQNMLKNRKLK